MSAERESDRVAAEARPGGSDDSGGSVRADSAPVRTGPRRSPMVVVRRVLNTLASLVKLVCWLIALLMVLYIAFVAGRANPANAWTQVVTTWAHRLNLGLGNLFTLSDPVITVLVNYGIAAIIWLIIGGVASRLIRRI